MTVTTDTNVTEKLLNRVRNLYAMSNENESSPHEAEIALRRCQSLMSKYGITEADLDVSEFGKTHVGGIKSKIPTYLSTLSNAVAKLHDCLLVRDGSTLEFRGYDVDTQVCILTLEYLESSLARQLRDAKNSGEVEAGRSASHDFKLGFSLEVYRRCKEIDTHRRSAEQVSEQSSNGTALVIRKLQLVKDNCGRDLNFSKSKKIRYRNTNANAAGRVAGASVSLNRQVNNTATHRRLN